MGAGLPAMAPPGCASYTESPASPASQLIQVDRDRLSISVGSKAAAFDFDLRRPVKHAGRNSTGIWGVNRQGCRFSRPAPWRARGGGPPNHCRITGTPSLGEVPSVGARALWLLWGFSKVTRCKSGTPSSRYLDNGYVPGLIQSPGRLSGRLRGQARSHSWIVALPVDCGRLSGRLRGRASCHSCIGG